MQVVIDDPRLVPIRDKVEAGERLSFDDGVALYRTTDILALGLPGQPGARAPARQHHLLQRQPPHQPHRRLRGQLPAVRLRQARARSQGLHHVARRGVASRRRRLERSGHRVPHRRRPASGADARLVLRDAARPEAALPAGAPEGLHHGGDRLPGAAHEDLRPRNAGAPARRRHGFAARRRRRDLQRARAPHHLRSQDRRQRVARDRAHGAPVGAALQLHHALRPHRERRGPRRPPGAPARSCRTRPTASSPSSRWPSTPTTRRCSTSPRPPASPTSRTSRWRA